MSGGSKINLPRNEPHERMHWTVCVEFDADGLLALAPLMAIVTPDIQRGDRFHERIKLFFAFLC